MSEPYPPLANIATADDEDDRLWPTLSGPDDAFPIELDENDRQQIT